VEPLTSPRVSVLIPACNAESTVEAAVESILRQSFDDFEIVAVDDGSTDSTSIILDSFARPSTSSGCSIPRVRVIHTANRGIIEALNTGIAECRGELIARMDADDISHPRRLEMQVALMDGQPEISVSGSLVRMFPRKDLLGGLVRYEQWLNSLVTADEIARDMFVESPVAHPSAMVRRKELIEVGGYQEHGWAEDYDLWLRYFVAGRRFAKVPKTLVFWRQSAGRLTFTDPRYSVENFLRAKAYYLARTSPPAPLLGGEGSRRSIVLWGAGKTGRRFSKHLLREGIDFEAVIDIDPAKIGHTLRGKPIVGVDYLGCFGILPFVIAAVSSHGARELIREQLRGLGFVESRDFICAA
jgi:glycosyltransferase involved in cell wall biosynthesis